MVVREPMNEDERQHDLKLQEAVCQGEAGCTRVLGAPRRFKSQEGLEEFREATPLASSFDVEEAALPLQCLSHSWSHTNLPK